MTTGSRNATADARPKRSRDYIRVAFKIPAAIADDAAGLLASHGALGCAVEGDNRTASRRAIVTLEAYFDRLSAANLRNIWSVMASAGMLAPAARIPHTERIVDPGWATAWKDRFTPLRIGRRLLIVPPWSDTTIAGRLRIVLNPGQGFGTGHHPTTRGALLALDELCAERRFTRALDVGTGSGVLAIAMRLFGIPSVTAVDIDPVALDNARENAALNSMDRAIIFSSLPVERMRGRFDLITANILSSTLIAMAPALKRLLRPAGRIVLGGILNREATSVLDSYQPELRLVPIRRDHGWTTLVLER
jgi:ribosomal protein L11 methyltransferase